MATGVVARGAEAVGLAPYVKHSFDQSGPKNSIGSVPLNQRGKDTMLESTAVLLACDACES